MRMRASLRERRRQVIYVVPNLLTTGNLFCGLYAIMAVFGANYVKAAIAILVALIFDILDGQSARWTKTTSQFGIEYDSLADLVSFGVAPGVLIYSWALSGYGILGLAVVFAFVGCGALRLARYNVLAATADNRSEEHTSELQSRPHLVCRLLLEKKKTSSTVDLDRG